MADIQSNIQINIDAADAVAELKSLQRQISTFHTQMAKAGAASAASAANLQRNLVNSINASGKFTASFKTVTTTAENFTTALEKNQLSMGQYFKYAGGATKSFGRLFKSEFDTINKVARERVKDLQTQYIKLGRDANGAMRAIAVRPLALDMEDLGTKTQITAQRQALLNQLLRQGSTSMLNFGKNTQWAGRQLMVGFSIPLASLGAVASQTFMDMEKAAIKFKKVYGDLLTPQAETQQALDGIKELGSEFTKYGVAVSATMNLAADAAAAGFQGLDLQRQTKEATRLAILGQVDQQQALETTISLQNAFKMSSEDLADAINFLNSVENQTVLSIEDLTIAIPKAAPVIQQLGGDVKDLAFFLTAMKEGGINASEGANALKSGLAAMINPTTKATKMLGQMGINLKGIVEKNRGDVKRTVIEFAQALNQLDPLNRARAIEQLFGKFQFARISTLFQNITRDGTQASRVLDLAQTSVSQLASVAEQELGITADSTMNKFKGSVEDLKVALAPIGELFLQIVTPIVQFGTKALEKFNGLSDSTKKWVAGLVLGIAGIGPVVLMTFGLLANGLANIIKLFTSVKSWFNKTGDSATILGEQTNYLTTQELEAAAAAASLDQAHQKLTQRFTSEKDALKLLIAEYEKAVIASRNFPMGSMIPPVRGKKFANGGIVHGPGTGTSDSIPAMISNGEAIVPAKNVAKNPALTQALVSGNIPKFAEGKQVSNALGYVFAHGIAPVELSPKSIGEIVSRVRSQQQASALRQATTVQGLTNFGFIAPEGLNKGQMPGVEAGAYFRDNAELATHEIYKSIISAVPGAAQDPAVKKDVLLFADNIAKELTKAGTSAVSDPEFYAAVEKALTTTLSSATSEGFRQGIDATKKNITTVAAYGGESNRGKRGQRIPISRASQTEIFGTENPAVSYKSSTLTSKLRRLGVSIFKRSESAIAEGASSTLQVNSPAKATRKVGEAAGQGFIVGGEEYIDDAKVVGEKIAKAQVDGMSRQSWKQAQGSQRQMMRQIEQIPSRRAEMLRSVSTMPLPGMSGSVARNFRKSEAMRIRNMADEQILAIIQKEEQERIAAAKVASAERKALRNSGQVKETQIVAAEATQRVIDEQMTYQSQGTPLGPRKPTLWDKTGGRIKGRLAASKMPKLGFGNAMLAGMAVPMISSMLPNKIGGKDISEAKGFATNAAMLGSMGAMFGGVGAGVGVAIAGVQALIGHMSKLREEEKKHQVAAKASFTASSVVASMFGNAIDIVDEKIRILPGGIGKATTALQKATKQAEDFKKAIDKLDESDPLKQFVKSLEGNTGSVLRGRVREYVASQVASGAVKPGEQAKQLTLDLLTASGHAEQFGKIWRQIYASVSTQTEAMTTKYKKLGETYRRVVSENKDVLVMQQALSKAEKDQAELQRMYKAGEIDQNTYMQKYQEAGMRIGRIKAQIDSLRDSSGKINTVMRNTGSVLLNFINRVQAGAVNSKEFSAEMKAMAAAGLTTTQQMDALQAAIAATGDKDSIAAFAKAREGLDGIRQGALDAADTMRAVIVSMAMSGNMDAVYNAYAKKFNNRDMLAKIKANPTLAARAAADYYNEYIKAITPKPKTDGGTTTTTTTPTETDGTKKLSALQNYMVAKLKKELDLLKTKRDKLKEISDEMKRQQDFAMKMAELNKSQIQAKISGDYLGAAIIGQQKAFEQSEFNRETQEIQLDKRITALENRISAIQAGARLTKAEAAAAKLGVKLPKKAMGGLIKGPGTATSDSIFAGFAGGGGIRVSDGEYVVKASTVQNLGVNTMNALNSGQPIGNTTVYNNYEMNITGGNTDEVTRKVIQYIETQKKKNGSIGGLISA